jgi:4-hydroxy-tetrahydrodipicolinate synthase
VAGEARRAAALHLQLLPLHRALFCEPSPAPTKWALAQLGRCGATLRLPLTDLTAAGQAAVREALHASGVL